METIHIHSAQSVEDALQQLSFPSFYDKSERKAAYRHVMLWGTFEERHAAEKAKMKYPFDEPEETLFSSQGTADFPVASRM